MPFVLQRATPMSSCFFMSGMYNEGQYYRNGYFTLLYYLYCLQQWCLQYTTTTIRTEDETEDLSVVARSCRRDPVISAEWNLQRTFDPSSRVTVNVAYRDCTVSLELSTLNLSSCISIPACTTLSRGRRLGRLALPAPEVNFRSR